MKKWIAFLLAMVLLVGMLAGCSKKSANKGSGSSTADGTTPGQGAVTGGDGSNIAAVTDAGHQLSSVIVNYYFVDYITTLYQSIYESFGENTSVYFAYMGINVSTPLNTQVCDPDTGETWADYFLKTALEQAKSDLLLCDKANAEGFRLDENDRKAIENDVKTLQTYAPYLGYTSADEYLVATYGNGATLASYQTYMENSALAAKYYNAHQDMPVTDAQIREHEKDRYFDYSSFTYAVYTIKVSDYLTGGTETADGTKTYTQEEQDAARAAAKADADKLKNAGGFDAFDTAITQLAINADKTSAVTSTKYDGVKYTKIQLQDSAKLWLVNDTRKNGDIAVFANETTQTDAQGNNTAVITSYDVVCFMERNDNLQPLANVRHLLVEFESSNTDKTGATTYSQEEKAAAKAEAERLLQLWKEGEATEESFTALLKEHTDDPGVVNNNGLDEHIHPESP